jgi:hypothetical protein
VRTSSSTSSSEGDRIAPFLGRLGLFVLVFALGYPLLIAAVGLGHARLGLPQSLVPNVPLTRTPPIGGTLLRFEELAGLGELDVLFVGSSHCYRTFDPRQLDARGLASFNLGCTAMSPLNASYLLPPVLERHRPRLVVFEVYSELVCRAGLESLLDLLSYRPLDASLVRMALAVQDPRGVNALLCRIMGVWPPAPAAGRLTARDIGGVYTGRGFVERERQEADRPPARPAAGKVLRRQLAALRGNIALARRLGAAVVVVSQPLPATTLAQLRDRPEARARIAAACRAEGVPYLDFNEICDMGDAAYFYDDHHFNRHGVATFMPLFLDRLAAEGLLPAPSAPPLRARASGSP